MLYASNFVIHLKVLFLRPSQWGDISSYKSISVFTSWCTFSTVYTSTHKKTTFGVVRQPSLTCARLLNSATTSCAQGMLRVESTGKDSTTENFRKCSSCKEPPFEKEVIELRRENEVLQEKVAVLEKEVVALKKKFDVVVEDNYNWHDFTAKQGLKICECADVLKAHGIDTSFLDEPIVFGESL